MINELTQKLESLGFTPPANDLLEWALGELPQPKTTEHYGIRKMLGGKKWSIIFRGAHEVADTPTQAALKLLITLKEEGVL